MSAVPEIKVLLVQEVPKQARILRELLEEQKTTKFQTSWVSTVAEATSEVSAREPDVILFDLAMPGGLEAFAELRRAAWQVPIIVLAGGADEELALKAVHDGAEDYLVKDAVDPQLALRSIRYSIERKRAEMALLQAEEKYRGIFENTIEGIFQTTPEGQYLAANSALARIYGYASAEELIHSLTNISRELYVEPGRRAEFVSLMEKNDVVSGFESRVYRKDGAIIWISENVRAVRDRQGQLRFYEGTVEDITERRRHEEELRNSETLYHSLVETLPQNIFRKNLNEQFTFANQRFCQTLGRELKDIIGKTDFDFFPAELAAKYQKDDQLIIETGKLFETVEENQPPGGDKLYVNVVKTPLCDASGRIIGLQGIFWDITEKRRAEDALKLANAELARSREELRLRNDQMEEDLRMAREIQQAIIPQQFPCFPINATDRDDRFLFTHRYLPTGAVGGDFFNIRQVSDSKIGVFICDVMGHGVRSALITAILRALVEELTPHTLDPGELLAQINRDLRSILKQSGTPLFTTAFYLIADLSTGRAQYANAGHPKPLLLSAQSGIVEPLQNLNQRSNPALGLFDSFQYSTASIDLKPNDCCVFYTDGVYDVECNGDMLSPDWLRARLEARRSLPMSDTFDEILRELRELSGGEFCDDLCLVGMELKSGK